MNPEDEERIENIVGTVMAAILTIIILGCVLALFAFFYDIGQLNGYCQAKGGKVEDTVCVKDDVILKRGKDL